MPVAFLLFSFIYEFLIVFDIVELNQYLHSLCASSAFPYSFFAIFYILGHKAIDRFFLRKYGEEQFAIYRYGNRYQYAKNILASFLFLVIFLLALILMKNEELSNLLSLRGMLYLPLLLPFILFYHERLAPRTVTYNLSFTFFYALGSALPYFLIFLVLSL